MIFRKITESERHAASSIQSRAFHFPINHDLKKPVETYRAAFTHQGQMTACLELIDYDVWFDGQTVGMGGIGGVASLPEYRRSGHVRGLFDLVFEEMRDRGDVFSWLFPFSFEYYRKFGYEVGCCARHVTIPLAELLPLAQPGRAEQFLPGGNPEPIITIYNDFACRYNMLADRTGCQWQTRLEINPDEKLVFSYVWYDAQDRPAAYFQYRFNEKSAGPRTMEVTDIAWRTHEGLVGLLGFMGRFQGNLEKVAVTAGPDFQPELLLPEPRQLEIKIRFLGMNRVINAQKALERMAKPQGGGSAAIGVIDTMARWNDGTWQVNWDDSGCEVVPAPRAADITLSAPAFAQLVTGYLPFEQLARRQDVEVSGDAQALARLFPGKKIFVADFF